MLVLCLLIIVISILWFTLFKLYKYSFGICKCRRHLVGKTVIITGGNCGIGYETAKDLADRGAKVIIACRNQERGTKARDDIKTATDNNNVFVYKLDLSSLKSVRDFVEEFKSKETNLDILINNAGDFDLDTKLTEDNLLLGMQVNYYGPFLLTNLLLPMLKLSDYGRIINVASYAYELGKLDIDVQSRKPTILKVISVYAKSKLYTVLSTIELSRRLKGSGVTVNALCPGYVATNILRKIRNPFVYYMLKLRAYFFAKSAWEGAQTQIHLAVSREVENVSGCYFTDCKQRTLKKFARDPEYAKKLWEESEEVVNLKCCC